MINISKIICLIPARRDSKRLKGKNKMLLNGKPLICYTIESALQCDFIDEIIVSTNDEDILKICTRYFDTYPSRIKVIPRPERLAQDDTEMWEVILHALAEWDLGYNNIIILLQPTSPLKEIEDIKEAYKMFKNSSECIVSVFKEDDLHYKLNGAIYIDWLQYILQNKSFEAKQLYIMPKERSLDIDTIDDFKLAEAIMKKRLEEAKNE